MKYDKQDLNETLTLHEGKLLRELSDIETFKMPSDNIMTTLSLLATKKLIKLYIAKYETEEYTDMANNYKENGLPEEIAEKELIMNGELSINKMRELFSKEELRAVIGILKREGYPFEKGVFKDNGVSLITSKSFEEKIKGRPNFKTKTNTIIYKSVLTSIGKEVKELPIETELIGLLTPEILRSGEWKDKKFRKLYI